MTFFTGVHVNRIDRKGRVSVPAPFRNTLSRQAFHGIVVYPATNGAPAFDGCGIDLLEGLSARFASTNPFDAAYDNARMAIFSQVEQLAFDGQGRVMLPKRILQHTQIDDHVAFAGLGDKFQIWEPERLKAAQDQASTQAPEEMANAIFPPPPGFAGAPS